MPRAVIDGDRVRISSLEGPAPLPTADRERVLCAEAVDGVLAAGKNYRVDQAIPARFSTGDSVVARTEPMLPVQRVGALDLLAVNSYTCVAEFTQLAAIEAPSKAAELPWTKSAIRFPDPLPASAGAGVSLAAERTAPRGMASAAPRSRLSPICRDGAPFFRHENPRITGGGKCRGS